MAAARVPPAERKPIWLPATAIAAMMILITVALVWQGWDRTSWRITGTATVQESTVAARITNISGKVELHRYRRHKTPPERNEYIIFNRNGMLIAKVTNGTIRYFFIGGDV
jgi:hypothetical protein